MSAGFKPEYNAYISRLVAEGRGDEALRFVEGIRESSRNPSPVVLGEHEIVPTPDVVAKLMVYVFESPRHCEQFIRRWMAEAAPSVRPDMPITEQARYLFRYYHPRVVATVLRDFYKDVVGRFVPPPMKKG